MVEETLPLDRELKDPLDCPVGLVVEVEETLPLDRVLKVSSSL